MIASFFVFDGSSVGQRSDGYTRELKIPVGFIRKIKSPFGFQKTKKYHLGASEIIMNIARKPRITIVGAGIAGLSAALSRLVLWMIERNHGGSLMIS